MTAPARPGCWTWSRAGRNKRSRPGSPTGHGPGVTRSRSSRWTGSPGSRPPPPRSSPTRSPVMDPFHVVRLAGDALDRCRRRVQQDHPRPPRPHRRPALPGPTHPAHRRRPAHRQTAATAERAVRHRRPRRGRSHLGHLPADDRRLPRTRPHAGPRSMMTAHRLDQPRRAGRAHRADHARPNPETASRRRAGLLRPARHQQRPDRGDQRPARTPPRLRPRLPQPHQLHRQMPTRSRRISPRFSSETTADSPVS